MTCKNLIIFSIFLLTYLNVMILSINMILLIINTLKQIL